MPDRRRDRAPAPELGKNLVGDSGDRLPGLVGERVETAIGENAAQFTSDWLRRPRRERLQTKPTTPSLAPPLRKGTTPHEFLAAREGSRLFSKADTCNYLQAKSTRTGSASLRRTRRQGVAVVRYAQPEPNGKKRRQ